MKDPVLKESGLFKRAPDAVRLVSRAVMGDDPAHGWPHVLRVYRYSVMLADSVGQRVDELTLETAVLLHDVGRFLPGEGHHAEKSAVFARSLLSSLGYEGDVDAVIHAIIAHSYSLGVKAETIEAMILSDADKLDALGAVGVARVIHTGCSMGRSFEESLNHFYEKILGLTELLYLEESRKIAERLVGVVKMFVEEFRMELGY